MRLIVRAAGRIGGGGKFLPADLLGRRLQIACKPPAVRRSEQIAVARRAFVARPQLDRAHDIRKAVSAALLGQGGEFGRYRGPELSAGKPRHAPIDRGEQGRGRSREKPGLHQG